MSREATEKIPCPVCQCKYSHVLESRSGRRRRQCQNCGHTFATVEKIVKLRPKRDDKPFILKG